MGFSDFKNSDRGDNFLQRKDLLDGIRLANRYIRKGLGIVNLPFIEEVIDLCVETHRYKIAIKLIQPLLEIFPARAELYYSGAQCHFKLSHFEKAEASILLALQNDPTKREYLLLAGEITLSLGHSHKADEIFHQAVDYNPFDADLLYEVSKTMLAFNESAKSLQYIQTARDFDQSNPDYLFQEALCFEALNKPVEALQAYDSYLFIKSNCAVGWYNRSLVLQGLNRDREALESCSFAVSIDELFTEALFTKANLHADLNETKLAIEGFEKLVQIEPGNAFAYYNLAALYLDECKYERSVYYFTKYLEIYPESVEGYTERGYCFLQLNALEDALSDLRSAILYESPLLAHMRLDTQKVQRNKSKLIARIKYLQMQTKLEPKDHLSKLIDYLLILRKHNSAIDIAKKYANKGVDKTFSLALLAKIYFILGNTILGYAILSQAAPAHADLFNNVKCLMPKTGASRLFYALFGITKNLKN